MQEEYKLYFKNIKFAEILSYSPETDIMQYLTSKFRAENILHSFTEFWRVKSPDHIADDSPLLNTNAVIKYIFFAFDENSGLYQLYSDNAIQRRAKASEYAGFQLINGRPHPDVTAMILMKVPPINKMIVDYLKLQRSYEYRMLILAESNFWESYATAIEAVPENTDPKRKLEIMDMKGKCADACRRFADDIRKYQEVIFRGDEDAQIEASKIDSKFQPGAAEMMAI